MDASKTFKITLYGRHVVSEGEFVWTELVPEANLEERFHTLSWFLGKCMPDSAGSVVVYGIEYKEVKI